MRYGLRHRFLRVIRNFLCPSPVVTTSLVPLRRIQDLEGNYADVAQALKSPCNTPCVSRGVCCPLTSSHTTSSTKKGQSIGGIESGRVGSGSGRVGSGRVGSGRVG